eukprot:scaffold3749_cov457-Prasinococcus_capsulatus_cf.AAC.3
MFPAHARPCLSNHEENARCQYTLACICAYLCLRGVAQRVRVERFILALFEDVDVARYEVPNGIPNEREGEGLFIKLRECVSCNSYVPSINVPSSCGVGRQAKFPCIVGRRASLAMTHLGYEGLHGACPDLSSTDRPPCCGIRMSHPKPTARAITKGGPVKEVARKAHKFVLTWRPIHDKSV